MAVEDQAVVEADAVEAAPATRRRRVGYDAGLAPSCMLWGVILGLGFLVSVEFIWGISHLNTLFR